MANLTGADGAGLQGADGAQLTDAAGADTGGSGGVSGAFSALSSAIPSEVGDLLNFAGNLRLGAWAWGLKRASFRQVPFAVRASTIRRGRKVAIHEYPFRDEVWVEDLGLATRVVSFSGFVVGDDVFAQRDAMVKAVEMRGTGTLVHPSLGTLEAAVTEFSASERWDLGRVVEFEFSLVQSIKKPTQPTTTVSTILSTIASTVQTITTVARGFINAVNTAVGGVLAGISFVSNAFASVKGVVGGFALMATTLVSDTAAAANAVVGLPGGRYAQGSRLTPQLASATVPSLMAQLAVDRGNVASAAAALNAVADPTLMTAATQALCEALRNAAQDPADQIRLLAALAGYYPSIMGSTAPIGAASATIQGACASLFRSCALVSLANATSAYQPTSYEDAIATAELVSALMDQHIVSVADLGDLDSYRSLRAQRTAMVNDLLSRAAALPHLRTVTTAVPMPSLTLAYELYADATRSTELIASANPPSPLFMPTSFQAAAA